MPRPATYLRSRQRAAQTPRRTLRSARRRRLAAGSGIIRRRGTAIEPLSFAAATRANRTPQLCRLVAGLRQYWRAQNRSWLALAARRILLGASAARSRVFRKTRWRKTGPQKIPAKNISHSGAAASLAPRGAFRERIRRRRVRPPR